MNSIWKKELTGIAAAVLILVLTLSYLTPFFFTARNLSNVLVQTSVIGLLACGQTFVILSAGIDLSVASLAFLVGAISGQLMVKEGLGQGYGILLAFLIGLGVGYVNGLLVSRARIPAFIVTLGGLSLWRGLGLEFTDGWYISPMPSVIAFMGRGKIPLDFLSQISEFLGTGTFSLSIPVPILILFSYYGLAYWVLKNTKLGRYTYAIGSNEEGARQSGIPVLRYKTLIYVICSFTAALAALVLMGRLDSAGGKFAENIELDAISAVILGGSSLFGGKGNVWGSLLGALLITMIRNGLNLLGVSPFLQMIMIGSVIIIAVWIDVIRTQPQLHLKYSLFSRWFAKG